MTESAFAVQPWLVERNGKFIQVTQLLYRIAELSDGSRSIDRIAADASDATGSNVSTEFVWRMMESRLVPIGIVAADPPFQAGSGASKPANAGARAPLALNMRMAVVSPRLINALTRILQWLYAPPVLVLLLFVTLQAQYWLLFVHGVAGGLSQALNTPGVVPIVLALTVASAGFHEFGHAAALRYGGGHVRGMGVGLYLVYPAFYTDVTENYRLGRWARVRTDLGGFYFNQLFSLVLMGVYHVTGQEFLLLVALLTDIEILHQCLPFVRLDGYWVLADLTGIPDFFSFMGAYLRSVLPVRRWKGRKLPRLKWWATVVFGMYTAITLPVIGVLLFATVKNAPRILITAYAAIQQKLAEVAQAQAAGDLAALAGAEAQIVLLLLPVLGLALLLFTLGRALALALWRWGVPTRGRRFASAFAAAAVGALLLYVWLPGLGDATTFARILDLVRAPPWVSAATPITPADGGTIPQAVAAMPPSVVPPAFASRLPMPDVAHPDAGAAVAHPAAATSPSTAAATATPDAASTAVLTPTVGRASGAPSWTPAAPTTAASRARQSDRSQPTAGATATAEGRPNTRSTTPDQATPQAADTPTEGPSHATARQDRVVSAPPTEPGTRATERSQAMPTSLSSSAARGVGTPTPGVDEGVQSRPVGAATRPSEAPVARTGHAGQPVSAESTPAASRSPAGAPPTSTSVPATATSPTQSAGTTPTAEPSPTTVPAQKSTSSSQITPSASPAVSPVPSPATN